MKKTQPRRTCHAKQVVPDGKSKPCQVKINSSEDRDLARVLRADWHDRAKEDREARVARASSALLQLRGDRKEDLM